MAKLKVYRTPIGFHDAYVAATSQKAALDAWGADVNLFARGVAEQVDDPAFTADALAQPGTVIKKLRGTLEEQLSALPSDAAAKPAAKPRRARKAPRPSRDNLDRAEAELKALRERQAEEEKELRRREAALAAERLDLQDRHREELASIKVELETARNSYATAVENWRA